jgi:hypothetical protein
MIHGSCCCGAVQFQLTKAPDFMGMCHCSRCRKTGASSMVFVKSEHFKLISGREHIAVYKAVPPYKYDRNFCAICGTALGEVLSEIDSFPINAHCLDSDIEIKNSFHEFVSEKPNWLTIGDDAKQFDQHPHD